MRFNKKKIVKVALCAAIVGALGYSFVAKALETKLIPFQGRLTDANGQVIPDGALVVQFKLYDAPVGGQAVWNGEVQKLSVNGGLVNTVLGTKSSLKKVDFSESTYLEITIDANNDGKIGPEDPPLLPRQSIIPAVFAAQAAEAKNAENAEKLGGYDWSVVFSDGDPQNGKIAGSKLANQSVNTTQIANGSITTEKLEKSLAEALDRLVPPGTIVSFGGGTVPAGWLQCDGSVVSSKKYPRLYAAIGTSWGAGYTRTYTTNEEEDSITVEDIKGDGDFNLPDLRGVFLRGVNGARSDSFIDIDNESRTNLVSGGTLGNAVGSYQTDAIQNHQHRVCWGQPGGPGIWGVGGIEHFYGSNPNPNPANGSYVDHVAQDILNARVAGETRPVNAYVNYIIKY